MLKNLSAVFSFTGKVKSRINNMYQRLTFPGAALYWETRYRSGGTSGAGSFRRLASFKAQVLNFFIAENGINSVIEFGCGDGNQLSLAKYPHYTGLDVSKKAIELCKQRFRHDKTKSFFLYDPLCFVDNHNLFHADLAISLDVIYHLVEDEVYHKYMKHLFHSAEKYVIIYSSDHDYECGKAPHVRHRQFSSYARKNFSRWLLIRKTENPYPFDKNKIEETSRSFFYIYEKKNHINSKDPTQKGLALA